MGSSAFMRLLAVALACTTLVVQGTAFAKGGGSHGAGHSSAHSGHSHTGSSASSTGHANHHKAEGVARDSHGKIARGTEAKVAFKHQHPCPSTGGGSGACPGFVIDHVVPLKRGGADEPLNMQWQTTAAAKAKDKYE